MLTETPPPVSTRGSSRGAESPLGSRRAFADLRALDLALIRSDLPAALVAFRRLQEDSPLISDALSRDPFPGHPRPVRALRSLGRCLVRGDLTGARRAFETFC